jgi:hypothetical protein
MQDDDDQLTARTHIEAIALDRGVHGNTRNTRDLEQALKMYCRFLPLRRLHHTTV